MNYSNDCGCSAPAPKPVKTLSVQPLAATEEIVCPDARCLPHLLNSLPETDDAVPNYVGVYKGQSYIAPIRALVDSVLMDSLNAMYRGGKVPTVVDYRDIESLPVVQKENCQKVAVTSMPTLAKAMTTALPAAPAGYEPMKVMTTDKEGDVYLAAPVQVVSPGLIPAIYDNCNKGLFKNVPALGSILGFGSDCKEFGSSTLKQLQEALSKVVGLAPIKTLPDTLRGYKGGEEFKYPVSLNAVKTASVITSVSGRTPVSGGVKAVFGKNTGPVLSEGLWLVAISFSGAVGWQSPRTDYLNFGLDTTIGVTYPVILANTSVADTQVSHSYNLQRFVTVPAGQSLALSAESFVFPGPATIAFLKGEVEFNAQQISQTNLVVNGVV